MGHWVFLIYALCYVVLIMYYLKNVIKHNQRLSFLDYGVLLLAIALIYENMAVFSGYFMYEGRNLASLHRMRFVFHAILAPYLGLLGLAILQRAGFRYVSKRVIQVLFVLATTVAVYAVTQYVNIPLHAINSGGILRYTPVDRSYLALIIVLSSTFICIISGVLLWWKRGIPWLFLGAVAVILGNAGPRTIAVYSSNFVESLLVFAIMSSLLVLYSRK